MSRKDKFQFPPSVRPKCLEAVKLVAWMLPKPYSYASAVGRAMRKQRLAVELAELDFLHRVRCDRPLRTEELVCAGMLLITSRKGTVPTRILPLEEPLLVNMQTFDALLAQVHARLAEV